MAAAEAVWKRVFGERWPSFVGTMLSNLFGSLDVRFGV